ncbi:Rhodanese-like domain-containing protein [Pseudomassariella vexata]|uniref:Rhodanese-like domain-containing protein n=1 Tax=Pseudomassariella vexata TaxID=1141098 RepID=A0A1Y2E6J6_9PEZI|nr:Rhodanese-like domain-containing protein [Pseudomassariella vexata]ORY67152.1 Rhodanese-like domain-containing protein [Pseudomassariella vexata]
MSTNTLLIDVRSPAEYATGFLPNALNIEYTQIHHLATRPGVQLDDEITLYCRSGRRSAIALQELQSLGFTNVRDIGSFEDARETLEAERGARGNEVSGVGGGNSSEADASGAGLAAASKREVQVAFEELLTGLERVGG